MQGTQSCKYRISVFILEITDIRALECHWIRSEFCLKAARKNFQSSLLVVGTCSIIADDKNYFICPYVEHSELVVANFVQDRGIFRACCHDLPSKECYPNKESGKKLLSLFLNYEILNRWSAMQDNRTFLGGYALMVTRRAGRRGGGRERR